MMDCDYGRSRDGYQQRSCNFPLSAQLWHPCPCPFPHSSHLDFFLGPTFYKKKLGLTDLEIFNVNKGLSVMMHILIKRYKSLDSDPLPKHKLCCHISHLTKIILPDGLASSNAQLSLVPTREAHNPLLINNR
jgi:hypothetical protein